MNRKSLHTNRLEQLFGPISLHILKQDVPIRIVELKDSNGLCRTLAIVRFLDVHGKVLNEAYKAILGGELLGKTLVDYDIDFAREYVGSMPVKLPDWLKKDFKSLEDEGMAFVSNIWVKDEAALPSKFVFTEIIEIIPHELKKDFVYKTNPSQKINSKTLDLFKEANIDLINA